MSQLHTVDISQLLQGKADGFLDAHLHKGMGRDFFVGIQGYDCEMGSLVNVINNGWTKLVDDSKTFAKYDGKSRLHQRGTRANMVRPTVTNVQDPFRKQWMVGRHIGDGNPLKEFRGHDAYLENDNVTEGDYRHIVPAIERYLRLQEVEDLVLAESFERSLGMPRGWIAARRAWGNDIARLLHYHVQGTVVGKHEVTMDVRGKEVSVNAYDIEHEDGSVTEKVVLISPHDDLNYSTTVNKTQGSLRIRRRDGSIVRLESTPNTKILNSGIPMSIDTTHINENGELDSHYHGGVHWGEIEDVKLGDEIDYKAQTVVVFSTLRYTAPVIPMDPRVFDKVPPTYNNVILKRVIAERGHDTSSEAIEKLKWTLDFETAIATGRLSDRTIVGELLRYEKQEGIHLLSRYKDELPQLTDMWDEAFERAA